MERAPVYDALMDGAGPPWLDAFDRHVLASILAVAWIDARNCGLRWNECAGLDAEDFADCLAGCFPGYTGSPGLAAGATLERAADEACLLDLLRSTASSGTALQWRLAAMLARRAQRPNHLWQDLGLRNRNELTQLMNRHFTALAARNSFDMKWKKFLYRLMCRDGAYAICTAPSCGECCDYVQCFGAESGAALIERRPMAAVSRI